MNRSSRSSTIDVYIYSWPNKFELEYTYNVKI